MHDMLLRSLYPSLYPVFLFEQYMNKLEYFFDSVQNTLSSIAESRAAIILPAAD